MSLSDRGNRACFYGLLVLFAVYAGAFVWKTSFELSGVRYFCLTDDAMVSMRYAKHLSEGHGLVWNPDGARVEGFTNGLWVFLMAAFHALHLEPRATALAVQITGAVCLLLNLLVVKRLAARAHRFALCGFAAVGMTAFYLPLNNWALQGLEVGALAALLSTAVLLATGDLTELRLATAFGCLAVATLVRLDMAVPTLVLGVAVWWRRPEWRRATIKWLCLSLAASVGLQTIVRLWYFDAWLPNTYYLKLTGTPAVLRWSRGALAALEFVRGANWVLFVAALTYGLRSAGVFRPTAALIVLGQVAYSVYVGGDVWETWGGANRFIVIAIPLYFVLLGAVLAEAVVFVKPFLARRVLVWTSAALVLTLVADVNMIRGPRGLSEWLLLKPPMGTIENARRVALAEALKAVTEEQATLAVVWAGSIPYFAERRSIDLLGKADPVIAREPGHQLWSGLGRLGEFIPGHSKWNYGYSIGQLRPDVVVELWYEPETAVRIMGRDYVRVLFRGNESIYFRRDSSHVIWPRLVVTPWTTTR